MLARLSQSDQAMSAPAPRATPDEPVASGRWASQRDPRAVRILAKTIYRELRQNGLDDQEVMAVAGELLSLLASEVEDRRLGLTSTRPAAPEAGAAETPAVRLEQGVR